MINKCAVVFVVAVATAAPVWAQSAPIGPGPTGPGPIGPGSVGAGPIGPGPIGPGPIGAGPIGPGPIGVGPAGAGPLGPGPVGAGPIGPMTLGPIGPGPFLPGPVGVGPTGAPFQAAADFGLQDRGRQQAQREREQREREQELKEREQEQREREAERREREREREQNAFEQGRDALDEARWERAISAFDRVAQMRMTRVDAALYYKAYAQNRLGQRAEALATLSELTKGYPDSRYSKEAKALEFEVRQSSGQKLPPESQADEDLKILAIQALQNSAPEEAIPMLEKLLAGASSPRVKDKALFVLAQSNSPRAREVLKNFAKGSSTPELQSKAIQYLGVHGGRESRAALAEVYAGTTDVDVKRRILRAFMVAGEKDRLFTAAQSEKDPQLRAEAVQQLGVMGAHEELWQLYTKESSVDVKKRIINAMFVGGNATRMIDLAKTEQNADLRRTAIRNLGLMGSKRTGDALVELYGADKTPAIRKEVINALFLQGNATSLVAIARKETDLDMKMQIVQKLSQMGNNPEATKYMLEILGK
jgi:HEAT repeat protein